MATQTQEEIQAEALERAVNGESLSNYPAIFEGFLGKGIPEAEIIPRENVFTYRAWQRLGRQVCKGEHGVKVTTWRESVDEETGKLKRWPQGASVFHISQTKAINGEEPEPSEPAPAEAQQSPAPLAISYGSTQVASVL